MSEQGLAKVYISTNVVNLYSLPPNVQIVMASARGTEDLSNKLDPMIIPEFLKWYLIGFNTFKNEDIIDFIKGKTSIDLFDSSIIRFLGVIQEQIIAFYKLYLQKRGNIDIEQHRENIKNEVIQIIYSSNMLLTIVKLYQNLLHLY